MKIKTLKIISSVALALTVVLALTVLKDLKEKNISGRLQPDHYSLKKIPAARPKIELAGLSLPFVANEGQWRSQIKYQAGLFSGK
ncbi:MAG: hypothetical protein GYA53_04590, partial [Acidobacteria bacterium]|nr:hypothetical protein [Acidobacteriota bacterium]